MGRSIRKVTDIEILSKNVVTYLRVTIDRFWIPKLSSVSVLTILVAGAMAPVKSPPSIGSTWHKEKMFFFEQGMETCHSHPEGM
jgi:hypothetical protein